MQQGTTRSEAGRDESAHHREHHAVRDCHHHEPERLRRMRVSAAQEEQTRGREAEDEVPATTAETERSTRVEMDTVTMRLRGYFPSVRWWVRNQS